MARVAEYLGVRTGDDDFVPVTYEITKQKKLNITCPFRKDVCSKAAAGNKPVCSVYSQSGEYWITCEHRLCATAPKNALFVNHQIQILTQVAKEIYNLESPIQLDDILVKREARMPTNGTSDGGSGPSKADYIMWNRHTNVGKPVNNSTAVVLEMQGGGETSQTGHLTRHIDQVELDRTINLDTNIAPVTPLITNAWRRQQEQFLVKGNIAVLTGARMVFCVGKLLYDVLLEKFREGVLIDLKEGNWTLAIIAFKPLDDKSAPGYDEHGLSVPLEIDKTRVLYTNYSAFVQGLINQGEADIDLFYGEYMALNNQVVTLTR